MPAQMRTVVKGVQMKYYNHFEGSGCFFIIVSDFWTLLFVIYSVLLYHSYNNEI